MFFFIKKSIIYLSSFMVGFLGITYLYTPANYLANTKLKYIPLLSKGAITYSINDPTIRLTDKDGNFFCSGVVIDKRHAVTAAHCVLNPLGMIKTDIILAQSIKQELLTNIIVEVVDGAKDVAILRGTFNLVRPTPIDFSGIKPPKIGDILKSCGFPSGQRELYCVELTMQGNYDFFYKAVGTPIFKGCSGGPVWYDGKVVAVNSAVSESAVLFGPVIGMQAIYEHFIK